MKIEATRYGVLNGAHANDEHSLDRIGSGWALPLIGAETQLSELDEDSAAELAEIFRLLGDGSRLRIAAICLGQPLCVGEIAEKVGLSPSLVSHHLRLLRAARFVHSHRQGKQVFYGMADAHVRCVITDMIAHVSNRTREKELP